MYRYFFSAICIAAFSALAVSSAPAAPIGQNLLTNPGFESSLSNGWNFDGNFTRGSSGPNPQEGNYYLAPNSMTSVKAFQTVDLAALGFDAHRLATGGYRARVAGYIYSVLPTTTGVLRLGETKADGSSNGTTNMASSNVASWEQGAKFQGLSPGTTKLTYSFLANNMLPGSPTAACLDSASLQVSEYSIWTYGNVTDSFHTRDGRTTDGNYNIGASGEGEVNVTRGKYWTTTGEVKAGYNYNGTGNVNISSGIWNSKEKVDLGNIGRAKVTITDNGTWKATKDVVIGEYNGNDEVNVNSGLWESQGNVRVGLQGNKCKVNIGSDGKWISHGEVRTTEKNDNRSYSEININGGEWESSGKSYFGLIAEGDYTYDAGVTAVKVNNGGKWTSADETHLSCTSPSEVRITLNNGTWEADGKVYVGENGKASVAASNGSTWTTSDDVFLGYSAGVEGTVEIGSGTTWAAIDNINIGYDGIGKVSINSGATMETTDRITHIGRNTGSEGTVNINGGTWTDTSNAIFVGNNGKGTVNVEDGGIWTSNYVCLGYGYGGEGGTVDLINGTWNTQGSTLVGVISGGGGTVNISPNGTWNTQGTVLIGDGGNGKVDVNGGTWNVFGTGNIGRDWARGEAKVRHNGEINATGEFKIMEQGTLQLESGKVFLAGDWENNGEIKQSGGVLQIERSGTLGNIETTAGQVSILGDTTILDASGVTLGGTASMLIDQGGTVSIASGRTLNINNLLQMPNGNGTILMDNALLTHGQKTLNLNGGNIEGSGQIFVGNKGLNLGVDGTMAGTSASKPLTVWGHLRGSGTLDNVTIYGDLNVGNSPGTIEADGLTLTSACTLEMELGGLLAGAEHDQIILDGLLTLDGVLDVDWYNNFEAILGDSFTLFAMENGASIAGQFNEILLPSFSDPSLSWDTSGLYTAGTISVVPEPTTLALLLAGGLAIIRRRK